MTDNQTRGVEQWRCSLCQTINDMVDDVCQGCKYDYMSDIDIPIATTDKIVAHEQESYSTIKKVRKKDKDLSSYL